MLTQLTSLLCDRNPKYASLLQESSAPFQQEVAFVLDRLQCKVDLSASSPGPSLTGSCENCSSQRASAAGVVPQLTSTLSMLKRYVRLPETMHALMRSHTALWMPGMQAAMLQQENRGHHMTTLPLHCRNAVTEQLVNPMPHLC